MSSIHSSLLSRTLNFLLASLLLTLLAGTPLAAQSTTGAEEAKPANNIYFQGIGRADKVVGEVFLIDNITGLAFPIQAGMEVGPGYSIRTGPTGNAAINLSNGTGIFLFTSTLISFDHLYQQRYQAPNKDYKNYAIDPSNSYASIYLEYGEIFTSVAKLQPASVLHYHTPLLHCEVKGTVFTLRHTDGDTTSSTQVYEGSLSVKSKTGLTEAQLDSLTNFENGTTPLENTLNAGQALTQTSSANSVSLVLSNIQVAEVENFKGELATFQSDLGMGEDVFLAAVATAVGSARSTDTDATPTRNTVIQATSVNTTDGPGFMLNVSTYDESGYQSTEEILGLTLTSGGVTTTKTSKTATTDTTDSRTTYSATHTRVDNADGSFTSETSSTATVSLTTAGTTETQTYTDSITGNADGSQTKTSTATITHADGTTTSITETTTVAVDANNKFTRTTSRTVVAADGTSTTTTTSEPTTISSTLTFTVNADNTVTASSTATDGTSSSSKVVYDSQGKTVVTTNADGSTTVERILKDEEDDFPPQLPQFENITSTLTDTDGDGIPDIVEDDDGDGTVNALEDDDGDGIVNIKDSDNALFATFSGTFTDTDGDGTPDAAEDDDGDGILNFLEDDDGDGIANILEDDDNDGILNFEDPDSALNLQTSTNILSRTFTRLQNGGFQVVETAQVVDTSGNLISTILTTQTTEVKDNGDSVVTTQIQTTDSAGNVKTTKETVTRSTDTEGTTTVTTVYTDADGNTTTSVSTIRRDGTVLESGSGSNATDDEDGDDGVDQAVKDAESNTQSP